MGQSCIEGRILKEEYLKEECFIYHFILIGIEEHAAILFWML